MIAPRQPWKFLALAVICVTFLVGNIYLQAMSLGLHSFEAPMTSRIHEVVLRGIAIALSTSIYGTPHDYGGINVIYNALLDPKFGASPTFHTAESVNAVIDYFKGKPIIDTLSVFYLGGEDVGFADYAGVAFSIFGYTFQSLFLLYFSLLGITIFSFLLGFRDNRQAFVVLVSWILALYAILPAFVLNPESSGLFSNRALPLLSSLATIHVVFTLLGRTPMTRLGAFLVLTQLFLVIVVVHVRASAISQILVICMCAGWVLLRTSKGLRSTSHNESRARKRFAALVLIAMSILLGGQKLIVHMKSADHYKTGGRATHSFWHMAYIGLAFHDNAEIHGLAGNDQAVTDSAERYYRKYADYMQRTYNLNSWENDISPWSTGKWGNYERIVRMMFFEFVGQHPIHPVTAVANKSLLTLGELLVAMDISPPDWLAKTGNIDIRGSMLHIDGVKVKIAGIVPVIGISLVLWSLLLGGAGRPFLDDWVPFCCGIVAVVAGSLLPGVVTAPIPHGMLDVYMLLLTLLYFLIISLAASILKKFGLPR
jgi:hypothetical protein